MLSSKEVEEFELDNLKVSILHKLNKLNSINLTDNASDDELLDVPKKTFLKEKTPELKEFPQSSDSSIKNVLSFLESERKKEVSNKVRARAKMFQDFSMQLEVYKKQQLLKKKQDYIEDMKRKENEILKVIEEYDKSTSDNHAQLASYYKNCEIRRQMQENEIKNREKEKQIIFNRLDEMKKLHTGFQHVYEQILTSIKNFPKIKELPFVLKDEYRLLNLLRSNFEQIIVTCKSGKIKQEDVSSASEICSELEQLKTKIIKIIEDVKEKNKKEKLISQPSHNFTSDSAQLTNKVSTSESNIKQNGSITNLKMYANLLEFYQKYLEKFKSLENDASQKQFILDCKKAINIPVNSLSNVNSEHILDKYNKLYKLLKGEDIIISDKRINANYHPEGISFSTNLLAKRFILQSDLIISSNPKSAFCYATVIMSLWNEFPEFGQLVLAYFFKTCPYLVPYNIQRKTTETDEDYYKRQGYLYKDGQIEKQDKYLKRMTGVMRLYAALMIVKPKRGHTNVYNIKNGWKWLVSTMKLEPEVDITATLVHTFLETVGFQLDLCYGKIFKKLIRIIAEHLIPKYKPKCTGGAATRLELLLTKYYENQKFETPKGYLEHSYW